MWFVKRPLLFDKKKILLCCQCILFFWKMASVATFRCSRQASWGNLKRNQGGRQIEKKSCAFTWPERRRGGRDKAAVARRNYREIGRVMGGLDHGGNRDRGKVGRKEKDRGEVCKVREEANVVFCKYNTKTGKSVTMILYSIRYWPFLLQRWREKNQSKFHFQTWHLLFQMGFILDPCWCIVWVFSTAGLAALILSDNNKKKREICETFPHTHAAPNHPDYVPS